MTTLDFAINMEMEGYQYYTIQANENKENELFTVFQILAESELNHAELIKQFKEQEKLDLSNSYIKPEVKSVFRNLEGFQKTSSKQLDSYRLATEQEEKSIKLYQDLRKESTKPSEQKLFDFLINEEQQHLLLFEEMVTLLTRPEEWVESAEFGLREEY